MCWIIQSWDRTEILYLGLIMKNFTFGRTMSLEKTVMICFPDSNKFRDVEKPSNNVYGWMKNNEQEMIDHDITDVATVLRLKMMRKMKLQQK